MKIYIRDLHGKVIAIEVCLEDSVQKLKEKLGPEFKIPVDVQKLTYAGSSLENGRTLGSYHISKDAVLTLDKIDDGIIRLVVAGLDQNVAQVVKGETKIAEVKSRVGDKISYPVDSFNLYSGSVKLDPDKTVAESGLKDNSTLHVLFPVKGGI